MATSPSPDGLTWPTAAFGLIPVCPVTMTVQELRPRRATPVTVFLGPDRLRGDRLSSRCWGTAFTALVGLWLYRRSTLSRGYCHRLRRRVFRCLTRCTRHGVSSQGRC